MDLLLRQFFRHLEMEAPEVAIPVVVDLLLRHFEVQALKRWSKHVAIPVVVDLLLRLINSRVR